MVNQDIIPKQMKMVTAVASAFLLAISCINSTPTSNDGDYTLATNARNGNISKDPDKPKYRSGEIVTLKVLADSGYTFLNWSGDATGSKLITIVTMDGNKSVTANFFAGSTGSVTDAEGNIYKTVRIGDQVWTAENLRTTKYNDQTPIPLVTDSAAWGTLISPGYCFQNNTTDTSKINKYGALYNWYAVNTEKLAPSGWHVPSDAEWYTLEDYLVSNGYNWDRTIDSNKIAKSLAANSDWMASTDPGAIGNDLAKNNRSGFSALPSGYRFPINPYAGFSGIGGCNIWWSSTRTGPSGLNGPSYAYARELFYGNVSLDRGLFYDARCGFSVRLLMN